ncbi:MAG: GNAT family N-acetyltransferase [Anaerolineae bacterium]|nr:MAG: GNAT family N-acetyltransferase [Anaerolineae bacterium]
MGQLRGCALLNGWQVDNGVQTLWEPLRALLRPRPAPRSTPGRHRLDRGPIAAGRFSHHRFVGHPGRGVGIERAGEGQGPARLRGPRTDDIDALLALDTLAFEPPWRLTRSDLIGFMLTGGHFVVAELDGRPMGYAFSDVHLEVGQLARLAVHPARQRQGIGSQLLTDSLAFCRALGRGPSRSTRRRAMPPPGCCTRHGLRVVGGGTPVMEYRIVRS